MNSSDLWPGSGSIHQVWWVSLCAGHRCRLQTAAWGKAVSEWCLAGRFLYISPAEDNLSAPTRWKPTPEMFPPYLLLVQQPAVRLQVAVDGWRVDLSSALGRLRHADHSLQHVHRGREQHATHAVVEARGQHRFQDGDLLRGQRGRLRRRTGGAARPETGQFHHLHQLMLNILGGRLPTWEWTRGAGVKSPH